MTDTTTQPPAAAPPPSPPTGPRPAPSARKRPRYRGRLIVVAVVLVAALVFLLVEGLGSSLNYFDTVAQAATQRASLGTTSFRLEGTVDKGSVHPTSVGTDFTISEGKMSYEVHNTGDPPDLFQAGIPVVVDGHFASATSDTFLSNQIEVKHSANYIAEHPSRVRAQNGTVR